MTTSKIEEYITSAAFMENATKGVEQAIAELRTEGIEPVFGKAGAADSRWRITFYPDGSLTANTPEALRWTLERFPARRAESFHSDAEQGRRRQAIDFSLAAAGPEGFTLSPVFLEEVERFVSGEIELDDLKQFFEKSR